MSTLKTLQRLWDSRESLSSEPRLLQTLDHVRRERLPGTGIARKLDIYLRRPEKKVALVHGLSSAESVDFQQKRILLLSLSYESQDLHQYVADSLQSTLDPVDVFLHYPYSRNPVLKNLVSPSYTAQQAYSLDTPRQFERFGDQVRFHYCDLRAEWSSEHPRLCEQRVHLLNEYAEYLVHKNEQKFGQALHRNGIEFQDLMNLDQSLLHLQGKIQKSLQKTESNLRDLLLHRYEDLIAPCRLRLQLLKEEVVKHSIVPVKLYIEWMGEINSLYQHTNALYVLLRMFRHYASVPDQHSEDAKNCVVILPLPMMEIVQQILPQLAGLKGNSSLLEDWFRTLA